MTVGSRLKVGMQVVVRVKFRSLGDMGLGNTEGAVWQILMTVCATHVGNTKARGVPSNVHVSHTPCLLPSGLHIQCRQPSIVINLLSSVAAVVCFWVCYVRCFEAPGCFCCFADHLSSLHRRHRRAVFHKRLKSAMSSIAYDSCMVTIVTK